MDRRKFVTQSSLVVAGILASATIPALGHTYYQDAMTEKRDQKQRYRPRTKSGMVGVAAGIAFPGNSVQLYQ
ncbi:hypothetical protein SAMN05443550_104169 [Pedobacter hartonius]|uniref:Uncharacterized protein n=1 Tax=Pedobacter hartonius TaxID=425514 RepID=A0A1H4CSH0_9SPHI|nr:hypothetical protein SAMN05443550_104169 [Pedobacter hartonius]